MRTLVPTLLLTAVLLVPIAAAGPTICMALECNPVYKVQRIVEETVGPLPSPPEVYWCQAEQCDPAYWARFVVETVGDVVVLP